MVTLINKFFLEASEVAFIFIWADRKINKTGMIGVKGKMLIFIVFAVIDALVIL